LPLEKSHYFAKFPWLSRDEREVSDMMNGLFKGPRGVRIVLCVVAAFLLGGIAGGAVAADFVRAMSDVWVPATALGLTLITAASIR
jgi:hypothetical protein